MKDVSSYTNETTPDGDQSASEALRRLSDDFLNGFSHSLTQPIVAMAQTVDRTGITNIATSIESPKLRETEFGTNGFWSQQFGSAVGMLPWFVAAQKASGKLAGLRHGGEVAALSSAPTAFVLERAAITGFSYGSLLTPTKDAEQLTNIFFLLNRSGQGFSSAASFVAMDGAGLSLGAARAKTAAERILAATSGGLLGGMAEAQLTAWKDGRLLPTDRELAHSATTMAVLGGGMAGFHSILGNAKHGTGSVERQFNLPGQSQQHALAALLKPAPIEFHASAPEPVQGRRYNATGRVETSTAEVTDAAPVLDRTSSATERAHQRDNGSVPPERWLPASVDSTHHNLLKTWAGFNINEKLSWLSTFDQVPPYQRFCLLLTELRRGGELQKEAIGCIPLLDPQSQVHAYHFATVRAAFRSASTDHLLGILHEMHPTARTDVLPDVREMHLLTKDKLGNDVPSVESNSLLADRVPEPTQVTATLRKDFIGIKGCDVKYEAHEYTVSGHSAKLLIDAARRNETRLARQNQGGDPPVRVVDMVALMDLMPDRRIVKLIEIPDAEAQSEVTAMEGQRFGEASKKEGSIGMFQGEYNPAFSNTFLHEWAHHLYFDHQVKNGGRGALAFETGAAMEKHKWNFNDYSKKNIDEQFAVHMGEGLLGSRSKFLITAWSAPIRSATMGRMLGENLATLPPEMRSPRHSEYEWRVQYLKTHIAPEAIRSVSTDFCKVGMEGQAAHGNLLGYLADGAAPFEILSKDPANIKRD